MARRLAPLLLAAAGCPASPPACEAGGVRWGGLSLTDGYRWFRASEVTLSGPLFGLSLEF